MAIAIGEPGWEKLRAAAAGSVCVIPAVVLTELQLAMASRSPLVRKAAQGLVEKLLDVGAQIASFEHRHAHFTAIARETFGKGNGRGGTLNFGDLMVYAIAKDRNEPLLCTGRDFAATDLAIHPASRIDP